MSIKEWFLPKTKRTIKQQISVGVALLVIMGASGLGGAIGGIYYATGSLPYYSADSPGTILPEDIEATTTLIDVGHFLEVDKTEEIVYREGFNSVEFALLTARNAHWEGLPAEIVALVYEDEATGHMLLAFPTTEDGWVFVEPQSDRVVNPRPGALYNGKRILRIDILRLTWEPFMEAE